MMRLTTKKVLGSGLLAVALGSGIGAFQAQAMQPVERPNTPHYVAEPLARCADSIDELETTARKTLAEPMLYTASQPSVGAEPHARAC